LKNRTLKASPIEIFVVQGTEANYASRLGSNETNLMALLNPNSAKQNKALRLAFKPNGLEQRTGTGAEAIGQLVGTKQNRALVPMAKVDLNEATKLLLTKRRAEVYSRSG
jgi:hypothetical protein